MITMTVTYTRAGHKVRVRGGEQAGGYRWQCLGCLDSSGVLDSEAEAKKEARRHAEACEVGR